MSTLRKTILLGYTAITFVTSAVALGFVAHTLVYLQSITARSGTTIVFSDGVPASDPDVGGLAPPSRSATYLKKVPTMKAIRFCSPLPLLASLAPL